MTHIWCVVLVYAKHIVRDIIAVTSGSPQGCSRVTLGWLSVTCRRHVPVVYSSPRSLRPHLLKGFASHQSILFLNRAFVAPYLQSPFYSFKTSIDEVLYISNMLTDKTYDYIKHGLDMLCIYPNDLSK